MFEGGGTEKAMCEIESARKEMLLIPQMNCLPWVVAFVHFVVVASHARTAMRARIVKVVRVPSTHRLQSTMIRLIVLRRINM